MHVLNVVDGCIPSDMATGSAAEIEEERRLLYVAMTRARDHLHLIVPQRFYVTQQAAHGDRHVLRARSAASCPPAMHAAVRARRARGRACAEAARPRPTGASVDIAARVRSRWS